MSPEEKILNRLRGPSHELVIDCPDCGRQLAHRFNGRFRCGKCAGASYLPAGYVNRREVGLRAFLDAEKELAAARAQIATEYVRGREHERAAKLDADASWKTRAEEYEWELRHLWWLNHGCHIAALYGDDGEMQCNAQTCMRDFKRDDLQALRWHRSVRLQAISSEPSSTVMNESDVDVLAEKIVGGIVRERLYDTDSDGDYVCTQEEQISGVAAILRESLSATPDAPDECGHCAPERLGTNLAVGDCPCVCHGATPDASILVPIVEELLRRYDERAEYVDGSEGMLWMSMREALERIKR